MSNSYDLKDRVAVVTGGAQGIGAAVVELFLKSGAKVASWDAASKLNAETMVRLGAGRETLALTCDVSEWESVETARKATERRLGKIDIVVNSAGIAGPNAPVDEYDNDAWAKIVAINLTGTYHVNKSVVSGMKKRNFGRIVNIASIAGKEGNPNACAYSASKAGVIGFTKSLGKECAGYDIAVNCVTPAAAKTAIFDQMTEQQIQYMLSKIPRERFLQLDEAASMIAWLASPENSFSTAGVFDLSGGRATY